MSDFIFDVSAPPIDHYMISLIDPQLTFAASGNNEWKEQHVRQLGWNVVDLPDHLFSSSETAATIRRLFLVFQGAIQYCKFRERQADFTAGQYKSKLKSAKKELGELFDELVELREATALMRLGAHKGKLRSTAHQSPKSEKPKGFSCYLCGNAYPSSGPLQSHLRKRHSISVELAQHASARCGVDVYQSAVELQQREMNREREDTRAREMESLKHEVTRVRTAISDLATKQGVEAQREIEFSRDVLSSSIQQVQSILAAAATASPPPQQPVQVVLTQQSNDNLLSKFEAQERRMQELEYLLQARRTPTEAASLGRPTINNRSGGDVNSAPLAGPSNNVSIASSSGRQPPLDHQQQLAARHHRPSNKRYEEFSEDDHSATSQSASPSKKLPQPSLRAGSLLAPVPVLLKLPRSPTVRTAGSETTVEHREVNDGPRQSSSTTEDVKGNSLSSPSLHSSSPQQRPPGEHSDGNHQELSCTAPAATVTPQEYEQVEVSQLSLPSKKSASVAGEAPDRSTGDAVNMDSQRISADGPLVSSASSATNRKASASSTSSDSSDSSSSSSSDSEESTKPSPAAQNVNEVSTQPSVSQVKRKKPSLFSRILAKVT